MGALLSSCNVYKRYSRPDTDVQGLYRDPVSAGDTLVSDTSNMGNLPWEKVFTDPHLQTLIRLYYNNIVFPSFKHQRMRIDTRH